MKRQLLTQMRNEWRSNIWMILELAIVGVVLWSSFTLFIHLISVRMQHYGYSTDNLYLAEVKYVPRNSTSFQPYADSTHNYATDLTHIRTKISENPYVEMTGLGSNSMPYNFNFSGTIIEYSENDSVYSYMGNLRYLSPEVVRMLKLEGYNVETNEQLAQMIEKGYILLSNFDSEEQNGLTGGKFFVGKDVMLGRDSTNLLHTGGVAYGIHRSDYESLFRGVLYMPLNEGWGNEVIIEVKPGMGRKFTESIKTSDMEHGNVYLSNLQSLDQMRESAHSDITLVVRNYAVCAAFLLIIIFLGFLGTFWFRIQQRTSEIAIRMVNGATRSDIFRRFLSEGMILLGIATIISVGLEAVLIHYEIGNWGLDMSSYIPWLAVATAIVLLAIMIVAGIWMPARKAMNINPASALKDQ
ncbi:MAG: FtsX-like permease family protein [Muribaculaceae bacterium]|nr:FtsX-like permease family protein [Muribaculaceae bacterium]